MVDELGFGRTKVDSLRNSIHGCEDFDQFFNLLSTDEHGKRMHNFIKSTNEETDIEN